MNSNNLGISTISKIFVSKLFGKYTYHLPNINNDYGDFSKVIILYGDNGSGKTKILEIIYHLLSHIDQQGHKSFLANIPFERFEISFSNGVQIIASREENNLIGDFSCVIIRDNEELTKANFKATFDDDGRYFVPVGEKEEEEEQKDFLVGLESLDFVIYFLKDSRKFMSNIFDKNMKKIQDQINKINRLMEESTEKLELIQFPNEKYNSRLNQLHKLKLELKRDIIPINRLNKWIVQKVKKASTKAEIDINRIYLDAIRAISDPSSEDSNEVRPIQELITKLSYLTQRSKEYSNFNFLSPLDEAIAELIEKTPTEKHELLFRTIKPYLDGIEAKLDALKESYDILDTFIQRTNHFLSDKKVEFDFEAGLIIKSGSTKIDINNLSSGERQLLGLFCAVITARDNPCLYLIDEPEISLNVKWQRDLIDTLLKLTKGSQIQFIFATHSIELLTQHKSHVLKLEKST